MEYLQRERCQFLRRRLKSLGERRKSSRLGLRWLDWSETEQLWTPNEQLRRRCPIHFEEAVPILHLGQHPTPSRAEHDANPPFGSVPGSDSKKSWGAGLKFGALFVQIAIRASEMNEINGCCACKRVQYRSFALQMGET